MVFKKTKPSSHPPVSEGYTRVFIEEIEATTDKAVLITIDGGIKKWFPKRFIRIHFSRVIPINKEDSRNVVDIINWLYDKEIKQ